ncbi:MAG: hypothetical protein ACE5JG_09075 [Planctomycetota bacterium]
MTGKKDSSHGKKHRRHSFLAHPFQLKIAFQLLGGLVGVGILYVLALLVLPAEGALDQLTAEETRALLLRSNLIYFCLAAAILWTLAVVLMHRVAGPVHVVEEAVQALCRGDYRPRLLLRERDHLKGLAAGVAGLAAQMEKEAGARREALRDLDRCLRENDVPAARELLGRLGLPQGSPAPEGEPVGGV